MRAPLDCLYRFHGRTRPEARITPAFITNLHFHCAHCYQIAIALAEKLVPNVKDNNHRIAVLAISCVRQTAAHLTRISRPQLRCVQINASLSIFAPFRLLHSPLFFSAHSLLVNALLACFGSGKAEVREISQLALIDLLSVLNVNEVRAQCNQ